MTALMMEKQGAQLTMCGKCEILLCYTHEVLFSCIVDQSSIQYALQTVCIAEQTVTFCAIYIDCWLPTYHATIKSYVHHGSLLLVSAELDINHDLSYV